MYLKQKTKQKTWKKKKKISIKIFKAQSTNLLEQHPSHKKDQSSLANISHTLSKDRMGREVAKQFPVIFSSIIVWTETYKQAAR
jgi:hypothetical protein